MASCRVMPRFMAVRGASARSAPAAVGAALRPAWRRHTHWHRLIKYLAPLLQLVSLSAARSAGRVFSHKWLCSSGCYRNNSSSGGGRSPSCPLPYLSFLWTRTRSRRFQTTRRFSRAGLAAERCPWACLYTLDYCGEKKKRVSVEKPLKNNRFYSPKDKKIHSQFGFTTRWTRLEEL